MDDKNIHYNVNNKSLNKILNDRNNKIKNTNDGVSAMGTLRIYEIEDGIKTLKLEKRNLILNNGLNFDMKRKYTNAINPLSHIQIGDDGTIPNPNQTALGNQIYRDEAQFTDTSNTLKVVILVPAGMGTGQWREAGIDNGNILYNRIVFNYIKGDGVSTYVEFTILEDNKVV